MGKCGKQRVGPRRLCFVNEVRDRFQTPGEWGWKRWNKEEQG